MKLINSMPNKQAEGSLSNSRNASRDLLQFMKCLCRSYLTHKSQSMCDQIPAPSRRSHESFTLTTPFAVSYKNLNDRSNNQTYSTKWRTLLLWPKPTSRFIRILYGRLAPPGRPPPWRGGAPFVPAARPGSLRALLVGGLSPNSTPQQ